MLINWDAVAGLGISQQELDSVVWSVLKQHAEAVNRNDSSICKRSPETTVTLVRIERGPLVCVKQYHWRGFIHAAKSLFRPSHGTRTFFNGIKLHQKGIGVALPLALVQKSYLGLPHTEWVIMETVPRALELDRYILSLKDKSLSLTQKRNMVRLFGEFLGRLHLMGIFHSDLKTCNIMVGEPEMDNQTKHPRANAAPQHDTAPSGLRIFPIDYDDVTFADSISKRQRIKNFLQLFLSTPLFITLTDRLRFVGAYGRVLGLSKPELRRISRKVMRKVWRKTILYVSPDGDVVENWHPARSKSNGHVANCSGCRGPSDSRR